MLPLDMGHERSRERLLIGEVAELVGITPKAVRHYEKLGLLGKPERSGSGYRLYAAEDLLRLHRIKKLQSLGLSLERIKGILGESGADVGLGSVLEALLGEVESQIEHLEERRARLRRMLDGDDPSEAGEEPYVFGLARRHLEGHWGNVTPQALQQEKKLWATLDAFRWPKGYGEFQEALVLYLAEHPQEYGELLALEERLVALAEMPECSPEVEALARDLARHFEEKPFPEAISEGAASWGAGPVQSALSGVVLGSVSPAQKRCVELMQERMREGGAER